MSSSLQILTNAATNIDCTLKESDSFAYVIKTNTEIKLEELENKIKTLEKKIIIKEKEKKSMKEDKRFAYNEALDIFAPYITKVEILNPDKVMRFTFSDDDIVKTICTQDDIFDFEFAFYLAYAKHFFRDILNTNGIEKKAKELKDRKFFNYLVKKAMKTYFNQKKEEEKIEKEKKERKEIKARQAAKKAAKKAKVRKVRIAEMIEAFKALKSE